MFELPNISIAATKPQLFLAAYLLNSWLTSSHDHNKFHHSSLMDDVFALGNDVTAKRFPVLEVVLSNGEVKICDTEAATSATATMTSLQVLLLTKGVCKHAMFRFDLKEVIANVASRLKRKRRADAAGVRTRR